MSQEDRLLITSLQKIIFTTAWPGPTGNLCPTNCPKCFPTQDTRYFVAAASYLFSWHKLTRPRIRDVWLYSLKSPGAGGVRLYPLKSRLITFKYPPECVSVHVICLRPSALMDWRDQFWDWPHLLFQLQKQTKKKEKQWATKQTSKQMKKT